MWVCPASPVSTRRYDYIEFENGKVLGEKKHCNLGSTKVSENESLNVTLNRQFFNELEIQQVDSWWRYLFWHCSYCFCMCDEQGKKSDRYFNLRPTLSNVTNNM